MKIAEHVKQILIEKELDTPYINEKMALFNDSQTRLESIAAAAFLDAEGRSMLAQKMGLTFRDISGFFAVLDRL